ncbi:hypothetical protein F4777DRAFT_592001 [Nemania sp. FL0916]|nr:hypothetical protein F4777DRAFT_592001 [Nemania sp. FL0916]
MKVGSNNTMQQQLQVFHHFGQLPTELRLMIWVQSWTPRTVTIYPTGHRQFSYPRGKVLLPASGYVNTESRGETLRHYKRSFAYQNDTDAPCWFNFELDTLCVACRPLCFSDLNVSDLRQLQRLIIPEQLHGRFPAETPCDDTWPQPVSECFESIDLEITLEDDYPSLREITLTTQTRFIEKDGQEEFNHLFRGSTCTGKPWAHMRTNYIGGLKVRHSPIGGKTYQSRYCRGLSKKDIDRLVDTLIEDTLW